ncbi:hypothetical protein MCANUFG4_01766 [Mycoplasmopsis canis UFG4]|uniref:NERD domain-containing protein n=2 Tax=Mycoplasmopsis canis TaxID=29555 RepID=I1A5K4_9BACT|nr:nuclease-related domain-containing protein [Mycoplasmopsis canis]EIE40208.1 hypothetical protein MCANUF33_01806 [Mycoplasmopsis canis UF33]EIE41775.1 hypothetical protein MCANUFG4_01766 [Mycoplasmopsis canis UFG4]
MSEKQFLIVTILLMILFTLILVSLIVWYILWKYIYGYKDKKKGFMFEDAANERIKKVLKNTNFRYIEGGVYKFENHIYEVDSILVSPSFLVVVEYKNFNGNISGDAGSKKFFLSLKKKNKKIPVNNPILQNEYHIKNVIKSLNKNVPYASLIVLPDEAIIQISNIPEHVIICKLNELEEKINDMSLYSKELPESINIEDIEQTMKIFKTTTLPEKIHFRNKIQNSQNKNRKQ